MPAVVSPAVDLFRFPNPVNDLAARTVAAGVILIALAALLLDEQWLLIPLAYGFVARVLAGPTLSPLGQLAVRVVAPRLGPPRYVPGPPKRFAQGIGAVVSVSALIAAYAFDSGAAAAVLLVLLIAAASLEAVLGLCIGCRIFAVLMRIGLIPASVCAECADIGLRRAA